MSAASQAPSIERELKMIWSAVLKLPDISVNEALFGRLGASSADLMHAVEEIGRRFGVELAPLSLLDAQSIDAQARLIGRALTDAIGTSVLATLARGSPSKTPLFLVHGADGHPYNYLGLVRRLSAARPVLALVSPALDPASPFRPTPELLAEYRDALLEAHPSGHFELAGWSYGGIAAYDLAHLLCEAGREVRRLIVFDAPPPTASDSPAGSGLASSAFLPTLGSLSLTGRFIQSVSPRHDRDELLRVARAVLRRDPEGLRQLKDAPPDAFGPLERLAARIGEVDGEVFRRTFLPGQSAAALHRAALVFRMNLLDSVAPRGAWKFPGEVVVFGCRESTELRGWQAWCSQTIEILEYGIQGLAGRTAHASMMDDANVELFAGDLSRKLDVPPGGANASPPPSPSPPSSPSPSPKAEAPHAAMRRETWSASALVAHHLVRCGYAFASTYPGSPTTLITDELERLGDQQLLTFRYATNEKVAFEMAAAVSMSGGFAAVVMKHVGLNVALDPAAALAFTGQRGALLLIVGDDPSSESSSNEQDSRLAARMLGIACLEPTSIDDLPRTIELATKLSVELGSLVMLRLTTALCYSSGPIAYARVQEPAASRPLTAPREPRFLLTPAIAREVRPHQLARLDAAARAGEDAAFFEADEGSDPDPAFVVQSSIYESFRKACNQLGLHPPTLRSRMAWPIAEAPLERFLARHSRVIVLEEIEPVLEEQAAVLAHRKGLSVRIEGLELRPRHGHLDTHALTAVIARVTGRTIADRKRVAALQVAPRPPTFCAGCPHTTSFFTLKRVLESLPERRLVAADIGCYTLGTKKGLEIGDVVLCMGASIGVATGAAVMGQKSIALIGDSTFLHAGLPALKNAIDQRVDLVVCVLDNGVAAMTGGQKGADVQDIAAIARALGASAEVVDPFDTGATEATLRRFLEAKGVSVMVSRSPCALTVLPKPRRPRVDIDRCTGCGDCVTKIHCPAISLSAARKFEVDVQTCIGCGFCSSICPEGALTPISFEA